MNPLKAAIFREVRKDRTEVENENDDALNKLMFQNPSSLRLSLTGFIFCKRIFTAYSFELTIDVVSRHRIALSKLEYPYYLTSRRLILFSEMDAVMVKLHGGVKGFLESYCQS
jgi:hypothetical protein